MKLWVDEPRRRTCLAEVAESHGEWFRVDRALFAPTSRQLRHPQPADKGTVWIEGEKRRLAGARWRGNEVWYKLRGTVPGVGQSLQCELDQEHRESMSRAHTAMHLFLEASDAFVVADPEVKGDAHARFTFEGYIAPKTLAQWLAAANAKVAQDKPVTQGHLTASEQARLHPQRFRDPLVLPDVFPVVDTGILLPCDGTHVARTSDVGTIQVVHAAPGKDGFVVTLRCR